MKAEATVFVVDDDPLVRRSLERLLGSVNLPVRSFSMAREFREGYDPTGPSCIVLDVRMPGMSGMELQKQLTAEGVTTPIIFISGHGDISMVADAMRGGAIDFLEKPVSPQRLLDRVQDALTQDRENRCSHAEHDALAARLASLSPREHEVVDLVVTGMTNKDIATKLGVSSQAVDAHRMKAMRKLGADSVAALARLVVESRLPAGARFLSRTHARACEKGFSHEQENPPKADSHEHMRARRDSRTSTSNDSRTSN